MWEGTQPIDAAAAAALIDWWVDAGADTAVGDATRDWLRAPTSSPPAVQAVAIPQVETLDALRSELATLKAPGAGARRVMPAGSAGAPVMLMTDLPAPEDLEEEQLFAGTCGRLLDAMLAAIGLGRDGVYIASVSPWRPASSRLDAAARALLGPVARRHVALAEPRVLLLLGDCATAVLLEEDCAAARGRLHELNHARGSTRALATLHPRTLLAQPALKAESWRDLRLLKEALA